MRRQPDPSDGPTAGFALGQVLALGLALGLYAVGADPVRYIYGVPFQLGDETRRGALAACALVYFYRAFLTIGPLRWRPMTWDGALRAFLGAATLQVGFAWMGSSAAAPLDGGGDRASMALFLAGIVFSAWSDLVRARACTATSGRSALCTSGPFALARHPDVLGNLTWGIGWALLTRSRWALLLPVAGALAYAVVSARGVERHLEEQERSTYRDWASRTKRFIPFVY